jgi:glycosyltransferase involved in cell wall biosynthesis
LKILVINYEYPPLGGGGGYVTRDIMERLAADGHGVSVLTSGFASLPRREVVNGVDIHRVPVCSRRQMEVASLESMLSYLPAGLWYAMNTRAFREYDVVNTHFAIPSGPLGIAISKAFGIPHVLTIHGGDIYDPSKKLSPHRIPLLSQVVRWVLNASDKVVAQSRDTRANAYHHHRPSCPIELIPLGIKRPVFTKADRAQFGLAQEDIVFCTIGRLVQRKNLIDTLTLIERLKKDYRIKLLVVGDGPERHRIERAIHDRGLKDEVQMLGYVTDETKFQALSVADIYVSTALHEGFGLVFLEAMACALPILSFNKGGQTDFLQDDITGFLIEAHRLDIMVSKASRLVTDHELRKSLGANNQRIVEDFFIDVCAARYSDLFLSTIKHKKA